MRVYPMYPAPKGRPTMMPNSYDPFAYYGYGPQVGQMTIGPLPGSIAVVQPEPMGQVNWMHVLGGAALGFVLATVLKVRI